MSGALETLCHPSPWPPSCTPRHCSRNCTSGIFAVTEAVFYNSAAITSWQTREILVPLAKCASDAPEGTNNQPAAKKTSGECLAEAAEEHGLDTLADAGLLALSFTPGGAAVKIGGTFALTAIGIANNVYFHSPAGAILPVFGAQFSALDTAVEQPSFEQLGILRTFARGFGGLSLARDAFLIAQQYQKCMRGG